MPDNLRQLRCIARYHAHLARLGRAVNPEESARAWVRKYAALWREHSARR